MAGPGDVGVVLGLEFLSKMGRSLDTAKYELLDENLGLRGGESEVRRVFEAHLWELAPYVSRSEVPCRDFYLLFSLSRWAFSLAAVRLLDSRKISRCLSHRVLPSWASSPHSTQSPRLLRFWYNFWL